MLHKLNAKINIVLVLLVLFVVYYVYRHRSEIVISLPKIPELPKLTQNKSASSTNNAQAGFPVQKGDAGPHIQHIQRMLNERMLGGQFLSITGVYDTATEAAVQRVIGVQELDHAAYKYYFE